MLPYSRPEYCYYYSRENALSWAEIDFGIHVEHTSIG
jgi:hypothetical protein